MECAINDPECSVKVKDYLRQEALKTKPNEDIKSRVDSYLGNPKIRQYGLGPRLIEELKRYKLYDRLFPPTQHSFDTTVFNQHREDISISSDGEGRERREATEAKDDHQEVEDAPMPDLDAVTAVDSDFDIYMGDEEHVFASSREERVFEAPRHNGGPSISSVLPRPVTIAEEEQEEKAILTDDQAELTDLHRRLQAIPTFNVGDTIAGRYEILEGFGPEWQVESWYKGKPQPPLNVRLKTILNFLADENADRCVLWKQKFKDVVSYLEWLAFHDDKGQLQRASVQTWIMFNDTVTTA